MQNFIVLGFDALFKKEELIGRGAFGEAWKVTNRRTKKPFIMKMMITTGSSEREKQMGRNEVEVLKSINHDNLVKYEQDFYENGKYLMVMEFCSGGDLKKAIDAQKTQKTHFDEDMILIWFGQLISGLKYMKKSKILHRDLKPNNVFLTSDNKIKIGDFGLAKMLDTTYEMAQTKAGARIYMAPERHRGERYHHKVDVWALGCIIYELCTLKYTFTNVPDILVGQYDPIPSGLHPGVSVYVPRLLRVDPNRRPSADQILTMKYIIKNLQILLQNSTYFSDHDDLGHPGLKVASRILPDSDGTSDYYTDGTLSSSYV